jgi:hypothetical protein
VLGPAALLHLSLTFPRRNRLLVRLDSLGPVMPRLGTLSLLAFVYALPLAMSELLRETRWQLGALYGAVNVGDIPILKPLPGQLDWVASTVFVMVALLGGAVLAMLLSYLSPPAPFMRVQVRWILVALATLFVSEVWGRALPVAQNYLAHQVVETPAPPVPEEFAWVALPVAVGVAVRMFRLNLGVSAPAVGSLSATGARTIDPLAGPLSTLRCVGASPRTDGITWGIRHLLLEMGSDDHRNRKPV